MIRGRLSGTSVSMALGLTIFVAAPLFAGKPPKAKFDAPSLSCAGSTAASINVQVCAGPGGAPAGFSLQWETAADYAANGNVWFASEDLRLCKASFSGNANLSRYNLGPNQCVTVDVGEFFFDNGASTGCPGALLCGTAYVFHAFAHATSSTNRSDFTSTLQCSTLPCQPDVAGCTYTQGYWKTHGPIPSGNNLNEWPVASLALGTVVYNDLELLGILDNPATGNGLVALAHQLIAAKLNIANGSNDSDIAAAVAAADTLIGNQIVPPVGSGYLAPSGTSGLTGTLTNYNEGATGPGHCD
jgi:hypothetical protein